MVRTYIPSSPIFLRRRSPGNSLLPADARLPHHGMERARAITACKGPHDRPQYTIYALLDAVPRAAGMVDRSADASAIRYASAYFISIPHAYGEDTDYYELAILLGACFLVNYVTADAKTNWVEGLILLAFYVMIVCFLSFGDLFACSSLSVGYLYVVLPRPARA